MCMCKHPARCTSRAKPAKFILSSTEHTSCRCLSIALASSQFIHPTTRLTHQHVDLMHSCLAPCHARENVIQPPSALTARCALTTALNLQQQPTRWSTTATTTRQTTAVCADCTAASHYHHAATHMASDCKAATQASDHMSQHSQVSRCPTAAQHVLYSTTCMVVIPCKSRRAAPAGRPRQRSCPSQ